MDGIWMLFLQGGIEHMLDTEKITINMSAVDLGKVDLLVKEALYSNRTDFIRTAIRNQLDKHGMELQQAITRSSFTIGALIYDKSDLEEYKARNRKMKLNIIGLLRLGRNITPELAREVIESIHVLGILDMDPSLREAIADKII
jgi:Arc/MetJ-type ribon-helix-helix transcriptional regulator